MNNKKHDKKHHRQRSRSRDAKHIQAIQGQRHAFLGGRESPPGAGPGMDNIANPNPMIKGEDRPRLAPSSRLGNLGWFGRKPQLPLLNMNFPKFPETGQHKVPVKEVLKWVLENCNGYVEEATGSMKIAGVPDSFPQLIVTKPTARLHDAFAAKNSKSELMFHGTPLRNLKSILELGFITRQVWVAKEPNFSVSYALGGAMGWSRSNTTKSHYSSYGALLGCEISESSIGVQYLRKYGGKSSLAAAAIPDPHDVMVRYVFLIPPNARRSRLLTFKKKDKGPNMPKRDRVKEQLMENIRKLKARIDGKSDAEDAEDGEGSAKGK